MMSPYKTPTKATRLISGGILYLNPGEKIHYPPPGENIPREKGNCLSCGAPMKGGFDDCQYCGREF